MLKGIADTHAVIWYVNADKRLSVTAKAFMDQAQAEGNQIGISSVSLAEVVYLTEKGRIPAETFTELVNLLNLPDSILEEVVFDQDIARTIFTIDRLKIPDLFDRMIAATAVNLNLPLISRDAKIQVSGITTIW